MPPGGNTVAAIPTTGDDIRWSDIEQWCEQNPTTKQWSIKSSTNAAEIAGWLNNDLRHYNDVIAAQVWTIIFTEMQTVFRNVGLEPDPNNDNPSWEGFFDTYHRQLPNTGQRNRLMRRTWNRLIAWGIESNKVIPCVPDYDPQEIQQDDVAQQGGLVLAEMDEVCQDIRDGVYDADPAYATWAPYVPPPEYPNAQSVHDRWVSISGGRRFGACTDTSVNQAITDQNAIESRNEAFEGTRDVRAKSSSAVSAADDEYNNNPNSTRASVNAAGDAAYNA